jgi:hypothetical protein
MHRCEWRLDPSAVPSSRPLPSAARSSARPNAALPPHQLTEQLRSNLNLRRSRAVPRPSQLWDPAGLPTGRLRPHAPDGTRGARMPGASAHQEFDRRHQYEAQDAPPTEATTSPRMNSSTENRRGHFRHLSRHGTERGENHPQKGGRRPDDRPGLSQALAALSELRVGEREAAAKLLAELVRL